MTYLEKYQLSDNWKEKVKVIYLFHKKKTSLGKWRIKHTAKYFKVSIGLVSENLLLGRHLTNLSDCKSRNTAIKIAKKLD